MRAERIRPVTSRPDPWHQAFGEGLLTVDQNGQVSEPPQSGDTLADIRNIFVFDFEMSGPNPRVHELLDLGAVLAELRPGLPEANSYGSRVRPLRKKTANRGALRIVGYTAKEWRGAPDLEPVARKFFELGEAALPAGWGIGQDVRFMRELLQLLEIDWPFAPVILDIQQLAKARLEGPDSPVDRFNLGHVADRLGLGRLGEHSALADAYAAYDVLVKLLGPAESDEFGP